MYVTLLQQNRETSTNKYFSKSPPVFDISLKFVRAVELLIVPNCFKGTHRKRTGVFINAKYVNIRLVYLVVGDLTKYKLQRTGECRAVIL